MVRRIRIVTYNIHKCRGLDGRVKPSRIVEVLRKIDADIIALQEVLTLPGKPEQDQARFIATELGFNYCLGENRTLHGGAYGNLLLSRFPMHDSENHDITTKKREQRGCLRTDIDLTETTLHVFNVHLGTSFIERRQQGRKLVGPEILQHPELHGPRIVLGDFNDWTHGLASQLLSAHFKSADMGTQLPHFRTYPGLLPFLHLDHIYFDSALKIERLRLDKSRTALIASDHLPLIADFGIVIQDGLTLPKHRLGLTSAKP